MTEQLLRGLQERHAAGRLRPNEIDNSGLSLLHQAALNGQLICMKYLVSCGGDLKARSSEGLASAHYAASGGHLPVLQYMYEKDKYCISIQDDKGITPLYIAAQEGQLDCLIWLNKYTSIKKTTTDGMTPSHVAAQEGRLDCLRYLLRVDRVEAMKDDKSGCSPIHYAAAEGHWRVIKWLVEHCNINGEDQTSNGQTALHLAAMGGHASVIEILLKNGVSVSIKDSNGKTALDYCSKTQESYQLLEKRLDAEFDSSFDSSDKKVRFNEMVYTYDTFPHYHHTLSENKKNRRKERSGIFWDEDLQAEFASWRSSPKLTKRKREVVTNTPLSRKLYKGRSKHLSGGVEEKTVEKQPPEENPYETLDNYKKLDQPDILKNLNDNFSAADKQDKRQSEAPKVPTRNGAPKLTTKNAAPKLTKKEKAKQKQDNMYNSLKRYHSIDIGEAFASMYDYDMISPDDEFTRKNTEKNSGITGNKNNNKLTDFNTSNHSNDNNSTISSHHSSILSSSGSAPGLNRTKNPPEVPVRKNSSNLKKLAQMYPNETILSPATKHKNIFSRETSIERKPSKSKTHQYQNNNLPESETEDSNPVRGSSSKLRKNHVQRENSFNQKPIEKFSGDSPVDQIPSIKRTRPIPPTVSNPIEQIPSNSTIKQYQGENRLSPIPPKEFSEGKPIERVPSRSRSPLRYRNMGNETARRNLEEERIIYDARNYIPPSPGFDEKFKGRAKSFSTADLTKEDLQPSFTKYLKEVEHDPSISADKVTPFSESILSKKKVGKKSLFKSVSSFFTIKRQKKPTQFSTSTLPANAAKYGATKRADIFTRFSLPRSRDQREFNDLFHSSANGQYKSNHETAMITTPQPTSSSEQRKNRKTKHLNGGGKGFKSRTLDTSLTGTNTLVPELEQQRSPSNDYLSIPNLNINGRMKRTNTSKKERVNAFIW